MFAGRWRRHGPHPSPSGGASPRSVAWWAASAQQGCVGVARCRFLGCPRLSKGGGHRGPICFSVQGPVIACLVAVLLGAAPASRHHTPPRSSRFWMMRRPAGIAGASGLRPSRAHRNMAGRGFSRPRRTASLSRESSSNAARWGWEDAGVVESGNRPSLGPRRSRGRRGLAPASASVTAFEEAGARVAPGRHGPWPSAFSLSARARESRPDAPSAAASIGLGHGSARCRNLAPVTIPFRSSFRFLLFQGQRPAAGSGRIPDPQRARGADRGV